MYYTPMKLECEAWFILGMVLDYHCTPCALAMDRLVKTVSFEPYHTEKPTPAVASGHRVHERLLVPHIQLHYKRSYKYNLMYARAYEHRRFAYLYIGTAELE